MSLFIHHCQENKINPSNFFIDVSKTNKMCGNKYPEMYRSNEILGICIYTGTNISVQLAYYIKDCYPNWAVTSESYNKAIVSNDPEQVDLDACKSFVVLYYIDNIMLIRLYKKILDYIITKL